MVVFSAREGVEAQSETVWRQADKYGVPRVAFINKMDREGADFENVFQEIGNRLQAHPVAIQVPVGAGPAHVDEPFCGVLDLIRLKMLQFDSDSQGAEISESDIPEEHQALAQLWRETMLEQLAEYSDELMELLLMEEEVPPKLIHDVIRQATIDRKIQPVMCGSACLLYTSPSPRDRG